MFRFFSIIHLHSAAKTASLPPQEELLAQYPPSQQENTDNLTPDDFAQLPMLRLP